MIIQLIAPPRRCLWSQTHRPHQQVFRDHQLLRWLLLLLLCCYLSDCLSAAGRAILSGRLFPLFFFLGGDGLPHDGAVEARLGEVLEFGLVFQAD